MGVAAGCAPIGAAPVEFESDRDLLLGETETPVLLLAPTFSSFDVWFDLPGAWSALCTLRAYAIVGSIRALVATVRLASLDVDNAGERARGVALTVRGRPAEAFEITAQVDAGTALDGATFFAVAWSSTHAGRTVLQGPGTQGRGNRYAAATGAVPVENASATIGYLSHRAGLERVEIDRIVVSYAGTGGGGTLQLWGATLSAEDPGRGGTSYSAIPGLDPPDPPASSVLVEQPTGDPTYDPRDRFRIALQGTSTGMFEWNARTAGGPIVLRSDVYGGFGVKALGDGLDDPMTFAVTFYWREIPEAARGLAHYGFLYEWRADRGIVLDESDVNVNSWTDQISDAVLIGKPTSGLAKPTLTTDGGAPCLSFTIAEESAMECVQQFWGPTSDYTIVMVVRTETSTWAGFLLGFFNDSDNYRTVLMKAYSHYWTHFRHENDNVTSNEIGVVSMGTDWKIAIFRRGASGLHANVEGTSGSVAGAGAASTHTRMHVGYYQDTTNPAYQYYCNMDVRHIAISRAYLSDDQCAAVVALLQGLWPDLS